MYTKQMNIQKARAFFSRAIAGLALILFFPSAGFCGGATPQHVALNMQLGIDNSDPDLFAAQLDFASIMRDAVDFMVRESKKPENAAAMPPAMALVFSSIGESREARERMVGLFTSETKEFVLYGVRSGAFAGKTPAAQTRPGGFLAPLFSDASMGRKQITIKGPSSSLAEGLVSLPVNVYDHESGYNYPVTLVLRKSADGWIVERIANLDQLSRQIRKEASSAR